MVKRLILVGMSGAGKTTIGKRLAEALGWQFADMDYIIEHQAGRRVPLIFRELGEPAFREFERKLLPVLMAEENIVISTGGGAVCNDAAQEVIRSFDGNLTIWMHATADQLHDRLARKRPGKLRAGRPMLDGTEDPLEAMRSLLASRVQYYSQADVMVPVGTREPDQVLADLVELKRLADGGIGQVELDTSTARSRIRIGNGIADSLPDTVAETFSKCQVIWIGVDANVAAAHRDWLDGLIANSTLPIHTYEIASGEGSKSLDRYGEVMTWLLDNGVQRSDVVVALGGGVVGDLMGYVAATVLRGIGLIQMPTTLLSMVDSSVGGKTGVNHAAGKNLIGAFYQPAEVLVDPRFLATVPERELRSGVAEIIKHGVIQASTPGGANGFLSEVVRLNAEGLMQLQEPVTSWVLEQNIALKASVVAADEREADLRQILNFGHTIGHAIEAAGYQLLHGEAIAIGMIAASRIAQSRGDVDAEWVDALVATIESYGFAATTSADFATVKHLMHSDKKKAAGKQNWVLPRREGGVYITSDVAEADIDAAIKSVLTDA